MRTVKKRRRERKTDYKARMSFLKSPLQRIIIRKTNRYIIAQLVLHKEAQDFTKISLSSKELLKYGWPKEFNGSLKSIPACYLIGFLLGKRMLDKGLGNEAIVDIGLIESIPGNRIYSVIKGVKDAGVIVKCDEEMFPKEERIKGMHIKKELKAVIENILEKMGERKNG